VARKVSTRVVLNRQALERSVLAVADGMADAGREAVDMADPPDATPYGAGLVDRGGMIAWVKGRKIDDHSLDGKAPRKPDVRPRSSDIFVVVGFGFPGRYQEFGTEHHAAQPFLTPVMQQIRGEIPGIVARRTRSL
jgi:HK97 gp10 family phage protein